MSSLSEALKEYTAVVITGGSSGIGKSFIELMAKMESSTLFCNLSRRIPRINFEELKMRHFECDVNNDATLLGVVGEVIDVLNREVPKGRVLVINNSGFGTYGRFLEAEIEGQLEMLAVNNRAILRLTNLLLPLLIQRGGAIINIASTAAFQATPYLATYGATKAFLLHWSLALGEELRDQGVHVLAVCPGPTSTGFAARAGVVEGSVPDSLGQTPEAVALAALRALVKKRPLVVTGWKNQALVLASRLVSKAFATRVAGWMISRVQPHKKR